MLNLNLTQRNIACFDFETTHSSAQGVPLCMSWALLVKFGGSSSVESGMQSCLSIEKPVLQPF